MSGKISTTPVCDPKGGAILIIPPNTKEDAQWYAVRTRSRCEKKVELLLRQSGATTFLPLLKQVHHWSDRRKTILTPLFSGYVFARMELTRELRLQILRVTGVVGFAGGTDRPACIPENQIEALRQILGTDAFCSMHPFLKKGRRVRICGGALDGVIGILQDDDEKHLVISIECIQRALSIRIEGYELEAA